MSGGETRGVPGRNGKRASSDDMHLWVSQETQPQHKAKERLGMRITIAVAAVLVLAMVMTSCQSVTHTHADCSANGFRNGTEGVLTDADLAIAWGRAQQQIAQG